MGLLGKFRFLHHRNRELDKRVEESQQRAVDAAREAKVSKQREKNIERSVVEPLLRSASHNQFAELIRQTLNNKHQGEQNA